MTISASKVSKMNKRCRELALEIVDRRKDVRKSFLKLVGFIVAAVALFVFAFIFDGFVLLSGDEESAVVSVVLFEIAFTIFILQQYRDYRRLVKEVENLEMLKGGIEYDLEHLDD